MSIVLRLKKTNAFDFHHTFEFRLQCQMNFLQIALSPGETFEKMLEKGANKKKLGSSHFLGTS